MAVKKLSKGIAILFLLISNLIFFVVPLFLIFVGIWKWSACPGDEILPIWMIFVGALIIIDRLIFWKRVINETRFEKTVPHPGMISLERVLTWEKDRMESTSRKIWYLMAKLKILFFVAAFLGACWSYAFISKSKSREQCDPLIYISIFAFSVFSMTAALVSYLSSSYLHCTAPGTKLDQLAVAALEAVF
ncbi:unnamed protein product [Caenorhabditis sp. 36 PRJEB53466]|nr:unnamed protein product [Caenorhabditis sp. 36 PRJEB53466]